MVQLNQKNFITGFRFDIEMSFYKIFDFFELSGLNCLYMNDINSSSKQVFKISQIDFKSEDDVCKILSDESNLFRIDLIVINLFNYSIDQILYIKECLTSTNIKFVILSRDYSYSHNDNINVYNISRRVYIKSNNIDYNTDTTYVVTDLINKNSYSFDEYLKAYKRGVKIKNILG